MSIKFRCPHCRQFLGISNSRAGKIVDCPTCGRSLRVPELDGRVRSMPKPALNLRDSGLVRALDEVAHIGSIHARELRYGEAAEAPDQAEAPLLQTEPLEPQPLPEVVPIEPPPAIEIVAAPPLSAPVEISETRVAVENNGHDSAIEELAALSVLPRPKKPARTRFDWTDAKSRAPLLEPLVLAVMAGVAILALGAGYWAGTSSQPSSERGIAANNNQPANDAAPANVDNAVDHPPASVRGRITEKTATGESRASAGAKIIAFPASPPNDGKLPTAGLRATAADTEFQSAQEAIRKAGGDVAVADNEGNFKLTLQSAGTYSLLVLSRTQSRDAQRAVEPALKQVLEQCLDRPETLPGEARYYFGRILHRGKGTDVWDYSFEEQ